MQAAANDYGCIVEGDVGVADTIGETIGDGVIAGCIPATAAGDAEADGDAIGVGVMAGCAAIASVVAAPPIQAPAKMIPANHRFIETGSLLG